MKAAFLLLTVTVGLRAATLVAPSGLGGVEGNTTAVPLFGGDSYRTQIIYGREQFSLFSPGGAYITELRFRMDGGGTGSFAGGADVEIHLSTTSKQPDALSADLAQNIGQDEVICLPRSIIQLSGQSVAGSVSAFSVVIPLPNHFYYNPTSGNLLVDASVFALGQLAHLDWELNDIDRVSIAARPIGNGNFTTILSTTAPVTQFVFEPISEPSVRMLILLSLLMLLSVRKYVTS
jgi:hypothetical protein